MTAPPWLKPPSTIFSAGMPAETSPSIICGAHAIHAERAKAPHSQLSSATTEATTDIAPAQSFHGSPRSPSCPLGRYHPAWRCQTNRASGSRR